MVLAMMASTADDSSSSIPQNVVATSRLAWIDLLRGLAVIGMVETHVVNTFLTTRFDDTVWRTELNFYNGLLAPAFLWIAGYVQGLSIRKTQGQNRDVFTWVRVRRLLVVALIGYLMNVPIGDWLTGNFNAETWRHFFTVNILPCLALSLAGILFLGHVCGRWFDLITATFALFFVFVAPLAAHWHTGIMPLDAYLNRESGSLFPLFPWFAFCAAGSITSRWQIQWKAQIALGLLLIFVGTTFMTNPFSSLHPAFFAERLGYLSLVATAIYLVSAKVAPRWLQFAGRESLFIYVFHLMIIHCFPIGGTTLDKWMGQTQSISSTALIFAGILGVSLLFAWFNEWRKKQGASSKA